MYITECLWAVVIAVLNVVTLSSFQNDQAPLSSFQNDYQTPLTPFQVDNSSPVDTLSAEQDPFVDVAPTETARGPIFRPPGTFPDSDFRCTYPSLPGYELCSTESDRACWLYNSKTKDRIDITKDYETFFLTGVTRVFNLTIVDDEWDADGKIFPEAKLFYNSSAGAPIAPSYPGPWIEACWGDTVIVNVTNKLTTNGTSVHWHGLRQLLTMQSDGVNGVTQCPIKPNDSFEYKFNVTQYGSSWYHSHYSVQYADGAAGGITLHGPSSGNYYQAISPPILMTDWGHISAFDSVTTGFPGDFDCRTILMNGLGDVTKFSDQPECTLTNTPKPPYTIVFDQKLKKYLIRIINVSFDTTFVFSIDGHLLSVVSADFVHIQPYTTQNITVNIGQRYDVIVEAKPLIAAPDDNYWIRTVIANCDGRTAPDTTDYSQTGILRYNASSTATPSSHAWNPSPETPPCIDESYANLKPVVKWTVEKPVNLGESFDVLGKATDPKDYPLAFFSLDGDNSFQPLRINYSDPTFLHLNNTAGWKDSLRVQPENYTKTDWVWLVIEGLGGSTISDHPIHLHGHDFAILEQAYDKRYNPKTVNLKTDNPPRRDVVLLPQNGYVIIAFRADNAGAWLVHCHIAFHISGGLGMQILEDQPLANKTWPFSSSHAIKEAQRVCTNWENWQKDTNNWDPIAIDCLKETGNSDDCFQNDSGV